jgi:hypothetical protein
MTPHTSGTQLQEATAKPGRPRWHRPGWALTMLTVATLVLAGAPTAQAGPPKSAMTSALLHETYSYNAYTDQQLIGYNGWCGKRVRHRPEHAVGRILVNRRSGNWLYDDLYSYRNSRVARKAFVETRRQAGSCQRLRGGDWVETHHTTTVPSFVRYPAYAERVTVLDVGGGAEYCLEVYVLDHDLNLLAEYCSNLRPPTRAPALNLIRKAYDKVRRTLR